MLYTKLLIVIILMTSILFTACEKTPIIPNEEELITTLQYTLTPLDGGNSIVFSFQDLDGDGGNPASISGGVLEANKTYSGVLVLLDETQNPSEDITSEILAEAAEHQFFFESTIQDVTILYSDNDNNGNPLGINTTLTTKQTGSGTIKITLRHEPNKDALGVRAGNIANAGGETDIEVIFDINVQ